VNGQGPVFALRPPLPGAVVHPLVPLVGGPVRVVLSTASTLGLAVRDPV
jgi:hypothetical protein